MAPVPTHCSVHNAAPEREASRPDFIERSDPAGMSRALATIKARVSAIALFLVLPVTFHSAFALTGDALQEHLASLEEQPFLTEALFKNGLKILINENRAYPVVAIDAVVPNCTAGFPVVSKGPESLLAAMFFRRERSAEEGTVEQNARLIGAQLSATVDYGSCHFEIMAPAPRWKRALDLHSRAVLDSAYDAAHVESEAAQLESLESYELESPSVSSLTGLLDLAFSPAPGEPQPTSPGEERMRTASAETLTKLHREMFSPGEMFLVVTGDIDAIEVLREAAVLYGELASGVSKRQVAFKQETQNAFRYRRSEGSLNHPRILFGFHMPGNKSPDFAAIEVLNAVVGLGRASILQSRIQNQKKLILRGTSKLVSGPRSAYWIVDTTVPFENMDRSEIDILVELELLKRKVLGEADLTRAQSQLERSYRHEMQTVSGRARALGRFEVQGDWRGIDRHLDEIRGVRPADLRRVAGKYLSMDNCSMIEYLPASIPAGNRTLQSVQSTLEALLNPATNQELASRESEVTLPTDIPEKDNDYRYSSVQYPFRPASILRGPEMYIREDHTTPLIHMGIFFRGGRLDETEKEAGITSLMVPLMLKGTDGKKELQFYRQLEIYGGRIEPVVTEDYFGFYFSIPSKNFGPGFGILTDILKSPEFDPEIAGLYKEVLAEERSQHSDEREAVYSAIRGKLFSGFAYGLDPAGSLETLAGFTPDSLKLWYDRHIRDKKPLVVIIGDSEGTNLASYFVQHFSGSRFQQAEMSEEFAPVLEVQESVEDTWERSRSLVAVGFQAPPLGDRDLNATTVLRNCLVLEMEKLKEDKSWVSSGVVYEPKLRGGSLVAYAAVEPGGEEQALKAMEGRIYGSLDRLFEFIEYRSGMNMALGDFRLGQQEPLTQIMSVAGMVLTEEGIEGYKGFIDRMGAVREEDLRDAAERIIRRDRAVRLRIYGGDALKKRAVDETGAP